MLQGHGGALSTVVYSDRYFRYGLPLHARLADSPLADSNKRTGPSRSHHYMPLQFPTSRIAADAGVLRDASERLDAPNPRYAPLVRRRRDVPRVFVVSKAPRFGEAVTDEYRARALAPNYRQPVDGVTPPVQAPRREPSPRELRPRAPSPARSAAAEAPRPEFALPDEEAARRRADAADERAYDALAKEAPPLGANVADAAATGDKTAGKALRRKVLNTERYNNMAAVRAVERGADRGPGRAQGRRARQRAAVRALLALSGTFYALALLAFYFLSLA
ncbi:unnamed protein product [Parnassius apollo]|uniref:(apollo) hypothetical protein n=1 Tax=Parnassius apollo TaxID=110799 RepID=A0A8S3XV10_PARAO|nr:unnamed protein product [Parnassius apollo]